MDYIALVLLYKKARVIVLTLSQNAKRGGHGAPKNMIGSRGADKVAFSFISTYRQISDWISISSL